MKQLFPDTNSASNGTVQELPTRTEISAEHKWRLQDIFPSDDAWEAAFQDVETRLAEFERYRDHLDESAETLLACLQLRAEIEIPLGKVYIYAGLKSDEDTALPEYQAFRNRASSLLVKLNEATAYIQPQILAIPEERVRGWIESNEALSAYTHYFEELFREKEHVLPQEQEELLAMAGEVVQGPYQIFSMFNNADIKFPSIKDESGNDVEVTKARYAKFMESTDRRVREDAFHAMYSTYGQWTNTLAATLTTAVKKNIFTARARKYDGALSAALDSGNIPVAVYNNVVDSVNKNLKPLHRYMALRKQMLELDALCPWDLSVPLIHDANIEVPFVEAKDLINAAFSPLGENYLADLQHSFNEGWIDVYENRGKRSGAYSWSTYGMHPYVLLNYQDRLTDLFTLAHELGHAMHSYYTHRNQPYQYGHYTIFVAEVASTFNEALLMNHLLKNTDEPRRKLYLLNEYIDQIRGTVFNQALFAEFEKTIHQKAESGEALTAERLSELAGELYQRYFGPDFNLVSPFEVNWCRVPHFYYNFYVYQYATGFSAATALSQRVLQGDTEARDRYLQFLSSGCSDYSINLLQAAGVDMTSPEPVEATAKLMDRLLDEMEELL